MPQRAEGDPLQREDALEAAAWRARTRLEELAARTAWLETECEAEIFKRTILVRERQALARGNERLRAETAELTRRLDAARDKVTFLQRQMLARVQRYNQMQKERAGYSRLLGRTVAGLLGLAAGRRPSRWVLAAGVKALTRIGLVDAAWYKKTYPDVAASGMDPVRHYLCHGCLEGRDPRDPVEK